MNIRDSLQDGSKKEKLQIILVYPYNKENLKFSISSYLRKKELNYIIRMLRR